MKNKSLPAIFIILLMAITLSAGGQTRSAPKVTANMPAPELGLERLLQASGEATADRNGLRGKVVVLDFWATWCAPCIASMPHLNDLVDKFKGKPVRFIAITDEGEPTVADFLKRRKINAWVGLDTDRSAFEAYGVRGIPHTVVVGRDGRVATITQPKKLTEEMLGEVLAGRSIDMTDERGRDLSQKAPTPDDAPARFTLTIKPTKSAGPSWSRGPGKFQAQATDLKTFLSLLHNVTKTRIVGPTLLEDARYDVLALMPDGNKSELDPILAEAIEASFKLKVRRELRETEVFVLTAPDQTALKLKPNPSAVGRSSEDAGVIAASAVPVRALVVQLEGVLKRPVIDETKLTGAYDWNLIFDEKDPNSIIDEARKELGLELTRAKKQIEVLVVEME